MAFLDNSGDIILDAVLTDTGRARLAKGDGSFKITKFALSDDEINYASYNKNHSSGSAYYDLEILQTPVLEAFTNNTSGMKSKLMSIPRTNLLYLPIMRISDANAIPNARTVASGAAASDWDIGTAPDLGGGHWVFVDQTSAEQITNDRVNGGQGMLNGVSPADSERYIRIEQGLNTVELPQTAPLDSELVETQFIVEIDSRLGGITDLNGNAQNASYVDDDNIASYYFSKGASTLVSDLTRTAGFAGDQDPKIMIRGPLGSKLELKIKASLELQSSQYLFEKLGSGATAVQFSRFSQAAYDEFRYIDSNMRIVGVTTGYSIDVPLRFMKGAW